MATGAAGAAAKAGKSTAPKRNNAARVFGYDVFISFALGPPPRGTHSYASDLARRLRERDFTVFFSEDEASPGEQLDRALLKGLFRSRTLVVIANRGTLQEPRWVRQEVEQFRSRHPDRPIIPISVAGAVQDATLAEQTQWLQCKDKIWLDESDDAVTQGIASDEVVTRLAMAPAGRNSNTKWRWVVRAIVAALAVLTVAAIGFGTYAQKEARIALTNARESKAREMAAYANGSLGEDPEQSILLDIQAVNATLRFGQPPVPAAEEALHQAILSSQVRMTLRGHSGPVNGVAYSPDGKRLATASYDQTAKVWDAESGKELLTLRGHSGPVLGVAYSPDGKRLATASEDNTAKVWDAESGRELLTLHGHSGYVSGVAYSPDGKRLATSGDKTAKGWDADSGKELLTLRGHSDTVVGVAYSPDGKRLATASRDKTAKVWDAETGKELLTLRGHSDAVTSVAYSPDGKRLATGSWDGTVQVYTLDLSDLLKLARSRVTRDLTPEECKRYFESGKCPPVP